MRRMKVPSFSLGVLFVLALALLALPSAPGERASAGAYLALPAGATTTSTSTAVVTPSATASATPGPGCGDPWVIVSSPVISTINDYLNAVAVVSENDAWAVGRSYYWYPGPSQLLVERWNGSQWNLVSMPRPGYDNELADIAVVSPNDIWAVGFTGNNYPAADTLIMHWNGVSWTRVPSPNLGAGANFLYGVAVASATDIWAVGTNWTPGTNIHLPIIMRWNGASWNLVPSPDPGEETVLEDVEVLSANDVWAVGRYGTFPDRYPFAIHWDGTQWTQVPTPPTPSSSFNSLVGISAVSPDDIWAVGYYDSSYPPQRHRLIERWDGSQWIIRMPPEPPGNEGHLLADVVALSAADVWAVGSDALRWNGLSWTEVPIAPSGTYPNFRGADAISSTQLWAVGLYNNSGGYLQPLIERYEGNFTDVHPDDYFFQAVRYLYCRGAVSGYTDGTFRPYNNTTRGQLSKIVVLTEGWPLYTPPTPTFSDVPTSDPFYQYIETAYNHGIITGYADGTFRPGNNVTRGQLCKIIVLAEEWPLYTPPTPTFSDVPADSPFFAYVETAYSRAVITGYADGTFRPGSNATRGQISKIIYNAVTAP